MTSTADLKRLIDIELAQPVSPGAHALTEALRRRYGNAVRAVLLYGSCLRRHDDEGVLDLYVFVDEYRAIYSNAALRLLNRVLPPNVFYLEAQTDKGVVRAKYAVLSLRDLARGTSPSTFEPYFWARFAQPAALIYAADEQVWRDVEAALSQAIVTMVKRALPLVSPRFDSHTLWTRAWHETYAAELRSERPGVVEALWANAPQRYNQATRLALQALRYPMQVQETDGHVSYTVHLPESLRYTRRALWTLRRLHGKARFLARMLRNGLIFEGGVDYVLWKIQRHSGIETRSEWRQQRHPLLALGAHAWRLYRAGAFR